MEKDDFEGDKKEKSEEKKKSRIKSYTDICRNNPWVVSTLVLGILSVILIVGNFDGGLTGNVVSEKEAGDILIKLAQSQLGDIEIKDIEKVSGLYEIYYYSGQGDSYIYMTLDGKNLASLMPIDIEEETSEPVFTEEQNALIQEFSSCLYDKGMKIYYAEWCGHCHNLIETFGGLGNAGEMMIECQTSDGTAGVGAELCEQENITGFPTIKINGEKYSGARTFDAFAEATGCEPPHLN